MTDVPKTTIKSSSAEGDSLKVELFGRDLLELVNKGNKFSINIIGCQELHKLVKSYCQNYKFDQGGIKHWPEPSGNSHAEILLRELILRARSEWNFPFEHEEICHCRMISTELVDQAIISGAHTPEKVSRLTSASTACGTCRPDVEKILNYRLKL